MRAAILILTAIAVLLVVGLSYVDADDSVKQEIR